MSWNTLHVISGQDLGTGSKPSSKDSPNNETMWVTVFYRLSASVLVTQMCPILCNPMVYSPLGSFVHGILQRRVLERVAIPFSRGSSWPGDRTWVSCTAGRFFTLWATGEAHCLLYKSLFLRISFVHFWSYRKKEGQITYSSPAFPLTSSKPHPYRKGIFFFFNQNENNNFMW